MVWRELLAGWMSPPGTVLWRTDVVHRVGDWNEAITLSGDRELFLRMSRRLVAPEVLLLLVRESLEEPFDLCATPSRSSADPQSVVLGGEIPAEGSRQIGCIRGFRHDSPRMAGALVEPSHDVGLVRDRDLRMMIEKQSEKGGTGSGRSYDEDGQARRH